MAHTVSTAESALNTAKWHVNEMLSSYGKLDSLLREVEGLEQGRVR
jgi:hypothetical protein